MSYEDMKNLARRPCGTNCAEVVQKIEPNRSRASQALSQMAKQGSLFCFKGRRDGQAMVLNQYFGSQKHLDAWLEIPEDQRPNIWKKVTKIEGRRVDRLPKAIQLGTWARAPMIGDVSAKKTIVRSQGISLGYDTRYELGPEASASFRGEFSKLGPGRYL